MDCHIQQTIPAIVLAEATIILTYGSPRALIPPLLLFSVFSQPMRIQKGGGNLVSKPDRHVIFIEKLLTMTLAVFFS